MKGHDRLVQARLRGRAPGVGVYLETSSVEPFYDWPETQAPGFPIVWVEPGDDVSRLDLRFVVGLRVCIAGSPDREWLPIAEACVAAGAKAVAVTGEVDGAVSVLWHSERDHADHP